MPEEIEEINKYSKPSFDARIQYYNIMQEYIIRIANAQLIADLKAWHRLARGLFGLIKAFIKQDEATKIDNKFKVISGNIKIYIKTNFNKGGIQEVIDQDLQEITDQIYMSMKLLFLPVSDETDEELDYEKFMKESEL